MKRLAVMRARPRRGYIAKCPKCMLRVVFAAKTNAPLHKHARSKLCLRLYAKRMAQPRLFDELPGQ